MGSSLRIQLASPSNLFMWVFVAHRLQSTVCQLVTSCQSREKSFMFKTSPGSPGTLRQVRNKCLQSEGFCAVEMLEILHNFILTDGNWSTLLGGIFLHFFY